MSEHKCPAERPVRYTVFGPSGINRYDHDDRSPCHGDERCFEGPADRREGERRKRCPNCGWRIVPESDSGCWVSGCSERPVKPLPSHWVKRDPKDRRSAQPELDAATCADCGQKLEIVRPGKHQHVGGEECPAKQPERPELVFYMDDRMPYCQRVLDRANAAALEFTFIPTSGSLPEARLDMKRYIGLEKINSMLDGLIQPAQPEPEGLVERLRAKVAEGRQFAASVGIAGSVCNLAEEAATALESAQQRERALIEGVGVELEPGSSVKYVLIEQTQANELLAAQAENERLGGAGYWRRYKDEKPVPGAFVWRGKRNQKGARLCIFKPTSETSPVPVWRDVTTQAECLCRDGDWWIPCAPPDAPPSRSRSARKYKKEALKERQ